MGNKATSSANNNKINEEKQRYETSLSVESRVASLAFKPLPVALLHIVGEYLSNDKNDPVKFALIGEHPITLCLLQDVNAGLDSFWQLGFLSPDCPLNGQAPVKIDKQLSISDHEGCLNLFAHKNSNFYRVVIDVLVVNLNLTTRDSREALDKLRRTIAALQGQLSRVKRVVISITDYVLCSFFVQDPIDKATGLPQFVDLQQALLQILDDLQICCQKNLTLALSDLFAFYVKGNAKPASDMYLDKIFISLSHPDGRNLRKEEVLNLMSDKIMWIYSMKTIDEFENIELDMFRLCHMILFDASILQFSFTPRARARLQSAFDFRENRFTERIIINSFHNDCTLQLPRSSGPLTNTTPLSALIELDLQGPLNLLRLAELNTGYFQNLTHLSVIGGQITGHLDSQNLPRLKTFRIEPGIFRDQSEIHKVAHQHVQSLICTDYPWQYASDEASCGWSFASYDQCTPNPRNEEKEGFLCSPPSLPLQPLIRELILCMDGEDLSNEFQSRLNGDPPLEAVADAHKSGLLVWAPERVEKIYALCTWNTRGRLSLKEEIPGKTRILNSLTCYAIDIDIDGAALPHLQSFELTHTTIVMSGAFPQLQSLILRDVQLRTPVQLDAPSLQTFICTGKWFGGGYLSLNTQLLPHLSCLNIALCFGCEDSYPNFIDIDGGLLGIKHVVLGSELTKLPGFDQWQVQNVSQLDLTVDPWQLPACWENTEWLCDELTICAGGEKPRDEELKDIQLEWVLPKLPRVKKLTVKQKYCNVLLNSEMPQLIDCTVHSPSMLGPNLKCPALECIRFIDMLSLSDKEKCLNRSTYEAICAQPRWIYFVVDGEIHQMSWDN